MQAAHDPTNLAVETEAVQAEAIVEALQTQLWGREFDRESFLQAVLLATTSPSKPVFEFSGNAPEALYPDALLLLEQWNQVPFHQRMELTFVASEG